MHAGLVSCQAGEAHITGWINALSLFFAVYLATLRAVELEKAALFSSGFVPLTALALVSGACITQVRAAGVEGGCGECGCGGRVWGARVWKGLPWAAGKASQGFAAADSAAALVALPGLWCCQGCGTVDSVNCRHFALCADGCVVWFASLEPTVDVWESNKSFGVLASMAWRLGPTNICVCVGFNDAEDGGIVL
eukprot:351595-Chlamydomonas_euryale.AAC.1